MHSWSDDLTAVVFHAMRSGWPPDAPEAITPILIEKEDYIYSTLKENLLCHLLLIKVCMHMQFAPWCDLVETTDEPLLDTNSPLMPVRRSRKAKQIPPRGNTARTREKGLKLAPGVPSIATHHGQVRLNRPPQLRPLPPPSWAEVSLSGMCS